MKISNADLSGSKSQLTLAVTAIAPTSGWKDVSLSKIEYVKPPEDGLQDFVLSATAPTTPVDEVLEVFTVEKSFAMQPWFQGVRISNRPGDEVRVLRTVVTNHPPAGSSHFFMAPAAIDADKLLIAVTYGGGCQKHNFQLNWDGVVLESYPPKIKLDLSHNNHGDNCMALINETLQFDLSVIPGFPAGTIDLLISGGGTTNSIRYTPPKTGKEAVVAGGKIGRTTVRGYSNKWDLQEAIKDAVNKLPDSSHRVVDYLLTGIVKQTGVEIGGIAGVNRLFVDLEG